MESALEKNAAAVIFAHNHPSGNCEPSQSDKQLTRDLVYAGSIMQLRVLDHLIIGDNHFYSFASEGLIEEYELDFLNLKMRGTAEAKRRRYRARNSPEPQMVHEDVQHEPQFNIAVIHGGQGASGEMAPVARELVSDFGALGPLRRVLKDFCFVLLEKCGHHTWFERNAADKFYPVLRDEAG